MRKVVQMKWHELMDIWQKLYENNTYATGYQSYEFLSLTKKGRASIKRPFECIVLREINYVLYVDDEVYAIAPMLIRKTKNANIAYIRGSYTDANYLDFIYSPNLSYDDFKFLMDEIRKSLDNVKFNLIRIFEKSLTFEYCKRYFPCGPSNAVICVSIPFKDGYDMWFNGLSKSSRKTIRNANNRLERDNMKWDIKFYSGTRIDWKTNYRMMYLYGLHLFRKNNFHFGIFDKLAAYLMTIRRLMDPMTKLFASSNQCFSSIAYINGEIAAFSCGFICNDGRIVFPRGARNRRYMEYSPGLLLIDSAIKELSRRNESKELAITEYDLSTGDEQYKYDYGGTTHYYYSFTD